MNHQLFTSEAFNIPQPHSQQPLLSSGQKFLNGPLHLLHGPLIDPMHLCILLHFKCKPLHLCSYLTELSVYISLAFLLADLALTTPMDFSIHIHLPSTFYLPSWQVYGSLCNREHIQLHLQLIWLSIDYCLPCNNHHRALVLCLPSPTQCRQIELLIPFNVTIIYPSIIFA
jgi:hypothetical protein